ncbi:hypothetical protein [Alcaligenes endophyticus]|uniref:Lipoprotein n=1 Tax=Alcaligenes endophyticus TaxID=1929088 RepID=A0ABT8EGH6_9BURK|nr:hypothetical protein [Alcaligenes endophyticus]MCX5589946.1 hypothetical protein [Alcaligenes endophyticus]MDN4120391.1 hypothetical protein [Alcaligenes endophyticus]
MKTIAVWGAALCIAALAGCATVPSGAPESTQLGEMKRWYTPGDTQNVNLAEAIALLRQPATPVSVRVRMGAANEAVTFTVEQTRLWRRLIEANTFHQHVTEKNTNEGLVYTFFYTFDPVKDAPTVGQSSRYRANLYLTHYFEDKSQFSLGSASMIMDSACLDLDVIQLTMARELIGLLDSEVTGRSPHLPGDDPEFISVPWDSERIQADCAAGTTADSPFASPL